MAKIWRGGSVMGREDRVGRRGRGQAASKEAGDKANFIAAARRAAQAAAAGVLPGVKRPDDKTPSASGEAGLPIRPNEPRLSPPPNVPSPRTRR